MEILAKELTIYNVIALSSTCRTIRNAIYENERFGQRVSDAFRKKLKQAPPTFIDTNEYMAREIHFQIKDDNYMETCACKSGWLFSRNLPSEYLPKGKMSDWTVDHREFIRFFSLKVLNHCPTWMLYLSYPTMHGMCPCLPAFEVVYYMIKKDHNYRFGTQLIPKDVKDAINISGFYWNVEKVKKSTSFYLIFQKGS